MENVYKVTLPSAKVVLLREMKVRYEDQALAAVGGKSGKNEMLANKKVGDEMLKLLIVEVDGKRPTGADLERLDDMFSYADIIALRKVVAKICGIEEGETAAPEVEMVKASSGAQ